VELKRFLSNRKPPEDGFKFRGVDDEETLKFNKRLKGEKSSGCIGSVDIASKMQLNFCSLS
jgi:hypothetical protein